MNFLTSDLHAGHANILKFCKRPFDSIDEMNRVLIENWNSVVSNEDTVYCLGDFAFGSRSFIKWFRSQLNGYIILVKGNHDDKNILKQKLTDLFDDVTGSVTVHHGDVKCHLSHYPYLCWPGCYRFEPQFYGHVHLHPGYTGCDLDMLRDHGHVLQYDVGVDLNGFTPITFDDAIEKVKKQQELGKNTYNAWCT